MAKVLTDIYSVFSFERICYSKFDEEMLRDYAQHFSLIENLILCEKVIVEKNGVQHFSLEPICESISDAFGYITDERLYKEPFNGNYQTTSENTYNRGLLYADVARDNEIYFSPHPYREDFLSNTISKYINATASMVINHVDQKISESSSAQIANININIPPVVEHVLYFSKSKSISITDSISEIRNSKNARLFRSYINKLDEELKDLSPRKRIAVLQPLFSDIDKLKDLWAKDMNEEVKFRKRTINLSKIPIIGGFLESLGSGKIEVKDPILAAQKPYLLFINELYTK